jgi:hypothetical protein
LKVLDWLKNKIELEKRLKTFPEDRYYRSRKYKICFFEGVDAYKKDPKNKICPYEDDVLYFLFIYSMSGDKRSGWYAGWSYEWYKDYKKELESKRATKST